MWELDHKESWVLSKDTQIFFPFSSPRLERGHFSYHFQGIQVFTFLLLIWSYNSLRLWLYVRGLLIKSPSLSRSYVCLLSTVWKLKLKVTEVQPASGCSACLSEFLLSLSVWSFRNLYLLTISSVPLKIFLIYFVQHIFKQESQPRSLGGNTTRCGRYNEFPVSRRWNLSFSTLRSVIYFLP